MKNFKKTEKGFAQLIILGVMALSIVSISVATKMAQRNQDNRSKAAEDFTNNTKPKLYFETSKATSYYLNETFEVTISVDSVSKIINGVDIVGNYDASRLELISIKQSESFVFNGIGKCVIGNGVLGKFNATCFISDSVNNRPALGKLLTLVFKSKSAGEVEFSFDCVDGNISDSNIIGDDIKDMIACEQSRQMYMFVLPQENPNVRITGNYMDLNLDKEYIKVISDDKLKLWLSRLDMAYEDYVDLTGWKPYNGGKIIVNSVECGDTCPGWAWAGQSISWARQWWQEAELRRINDNNDWSFGILHEMSHDFDNYESWGDFDNEMMANFKMAYVLEKRNAVVQPNGDGIYYTGTDIMKVYKSHPQYGYDVVLQKYKDGKNDDLKQSIGNFLNYKLLIIKNDIGGWDTYKQVFRNLGDKKIEGQNNKINAFFDEMSKVSKKDVRNMFTKEERDILEIRFGKIFELKTKITPTSTISIPTKGSKVDGKCGTTKDSCVTGNFIDISDSNLYYMWKCKGTNGGTTKVCSLKKTAKIDGKCGDTKNTCIAGKVDPLYGTLRSDRWRCLGLNGGKTISCLTWK